MTDIVERSDHILGICDKARKLYTWAHLLLLLYVSGSTSPAMTVPFFSLPSLRTCLSDVEYIYIYEYSHVGKCAEIWTKDLHKTLTLQHFLLLDLKIRREYLPAFFNLSLIYFLTFPAIFIILRELIIVRVLFYPVLILIITYLLYTASLWNSSVIFATSSPYHHLNIA